MYGGAAKTLALATLSSIGLGTLPQGAPNQRPLMYIYIYNFMYVYIYMYMYMYMYGSSCFLLKHVPDL